MEPCVLSRAAADSAEHQILVIVVELGKVPQHLVLGPDKPCPIFPNLVSFRGHWLLAS